MDLFDMLGFEPEVPTTKEKKVKKASAPKTASKSTSTAVKVKLPCHVITGLMNEIIYTAQDFTTEAGCATVLLDSVIAKFAEQYPEFSKEFTSYRVVGDCVYVSHISSNASVKSNIEVTQNTKYMLGGTALDLSAFMTDTACTINAQTLIEAFEKEYPSFGSVSILNDVATDIITPVFTSPKLTGSEKLPLNVVCWNRSPFVIESNEVSEGEDTEDGGADDAPTGDLLDFIKSNVAEFWPGFPKDSIDLLYNEKENTVIVVMKEEKAKAPAPASGKKEYPTNAVVSLFVATKFTLEPSMFGGKDVVTEDEFIKWLGEKYPEFSKERTFIVYDKKNNIIMPCLKSSSKGALDVANDDSEAEDLRKKGFPFLRNYPDGLYRIEDNALGHFCVSVSGGNEHNSFTMAIPKIPGGILLAADKFFAAVAAKLNTEAMLQLFYDLDSQRFFFYCPVQNASYGAVQIERVYELEHRYVLVADFHSHGNIIPFWSSTDNTDEKGTRLYGVFGDYRKRTVRPKFRVGCGGFFFDLESYDAANVFDTSICNDAKIGEIAARLYIAFSFQRPLIVH